MKLVKESLDESNSTFEKLIKTAERDGHIKSHEASAQYIMDAAKKIAKKWDSLNTEEKKVYRTSLYNKFLELIHKK
jgi:hypothetical protein